MNPHDKIVDFCLSLIYAGKNLEDYKEYNDVVKIVDKTYLSEIKKYQFFLQNNTRYIEFFVNEEFNLLSYILVVQQITSFEELSSFLRDVSKDQLFQIISTHILDKETKFSTKDLLDVSLEEKNKWKLTELYYHYPQIKKKLLEIIEQSWNQYLQVVTNLEKDFYSKIIQEKKRLADKSSELYAVVFQHYISENDYASAQNNHLLLVSFQKILFIKLEKDTTLGLGLFTYDYLNFIKSMNSYSQESREKFLKILADPTRYGILKLIIEGVSTNKVIANKFGISSAAVSYQLKNLLDNKIIIVEPGGRKYSLNKDLLKQIISGIEKELFLD
ncbi:ArsR/SmtB family transcription factor [Streptococcus marmotae]|uniref:ArsR/SmtB family transcription factor n=1 Tax=Streptococcus marmotae TaxID=1825069 RepID=UPI000830C134|nr:helix-turn-helix domain-containing protein [Streptococcus marmotae]